MASEVEIQFYSDARSALTPRPRSVRTRNGCGSAAKISEPSLTGIKSNRKGVTGRSSARLTTTTEPSIAERASMPHHRVYVIELSKDVLNEPQFVAANPQHRSDKPCFYVGVTGLDPEERFARHMAGIQASRLVKKYGLRLRPDRYERFAPMTYPEAAAMEEEVARRLRNTGFAVWQH